MTPPPARPGAFVVSLDMELHWGVREATAVDGGYRANLLGARQAIPALLDLFGEFEVAATWAVVGFLFAATKEELEAYIPAVKPAYVRPELSAYDEPIGADETSDPFHFGRSLVDRVRKSPRQEVASHTFSHFYCLEPGSDEMAFRADIEAALAIATAQGIKLQSIVFPRNQLNPDYLGTLGDLGVLAYRGYQPGRIYHARDEDERRWWLRILRLADAYVNLSGPGLHDWPAESPSGVTNVAASRFLRPYHPRLRGLDPLRRRRIVRAMREAAATGRLFHLWWHPHNFGLNTTANLAFLRTILEEYASLRNSHGMLSLTMAEVAEASVSAAG
jgi:peptidoglycan/xylan/chitin deacetylase (PgdA/CDA1 family)